MTVDRTRAEYLTIHPLQAILLAFMFPMFLAALLSDITYVRSFEVQWANFAAWLIAGGLVGGGFALLWAIINVFRKPANRRGAPLWFGLLLFAAFVVGFINALIHAKDAYATMPAGLILSAVAALLAFAASWLGFSASNRGERL